MTVDTGRKRIALVGFDQETGSCFSEAGFDVVGHIYANPKDKNAKSVNSPREVNFHFWKQYRFDTEIPPSASPELKQKIKNACFDAFVRCTDRWDWSRQLIFDWGDYNHLFSLACDWAGDWLSKHTPDTLVFSNVPHQGIALVLFQLARETGVDTKIFVQSPFSGRSWLIDHWTDLGEFSSSHKGEPFEIDAAPPTEPPFYMANTRSDFVRRLRTFGHQLRAQVVIGSGFPWFAPQARREIVQRNLGRWQRSVENARYLKDAKTYFNETPDDESYVYFPLHLQPEMTTDVLGGNHADQLNALEALRNLVPSNIPIYVKENPKQTGRLRSKAFFNRLNAIPNIKLLDKTVPSFGLTKNALAVATITGTAGWEAIRMGKPAICFGSAFWNCLPGAFRFSKQTEWSHIEAFEFDPTRLKNAVAQLSEYCHPGVCDLNYAGLVPGFDAKENGKALAKTLMSAKVAS